MPKHPTRAERPLDGVASIKIKIGLLVALSIAAAAVVLQVGSRAGVPAWLSLPVTLAAALGVTQWLARGMTSPLLEMTRAASRMVTGDRTVRVTASRARCRRPGGAARTLPRRAWGVMGTGDHRCQP